MSACYPRIIVLRNKSNGQNDLTEIHAQSRAVVSVVSPVRMNCPRSLPRPRFQTSRTSPRCPSVSSKSTIERVLSGLHKLQTPNRIVCRDGHGHSQNPTARTFCSPNRLSPVNSFGDKPRGDATILKQSPFRRSIDYVSLRDRRSGDTRGWRCDSRRARVDRPAESANKISGTPFVRSPRAVTGFDRIRRYAISAALYAIPRQRIACRRFRDSVTHAAKHARRYHRYRRLLYRGAIIIIIIVAAIVTRRLLIVRGKKRRGDSLLTRFPCTYYARVSPPETLRADLLLPRGRMPAVFFSTFASHKFPLRSSLNDLSVFLSV
ncbi:Hypothetical protein CINCED_3A025825 [Cinara cedri]|uniref:Uncharacterized protein n=1 Tax=Cinara cedri TaxID=506608 RepID=A0A5E4MLD7_9HEMI|nr:Hypothetical protein CINCED_3A025825 [Cinara cedri]